MRNCDTSRAFTLVELLVVIAIVAILASLLLPALGRTKEKAAQTDCAGHLRSLQMAATLYSADYQGMFPPERLENPWNLALKPYFVASQILNCPSDKLFPSVVNPADSPAPRSYLANGFNEVVQATFDKSKPVKPQFFFSSWTSLKDSSIPLPSETIYFGEKSSVSMAFYVNLITDGSAFLGDLEEERHRVAAVATSRGVSNYSFCDGSVRKLGFGKSTCPLNLWALSEPLRSDAAICRPRH